MFKRNAAVTGFQIGHFIQTADGAAKTTGTPACKRLLDGAAGTLTNAASYDGTAGVWKIDLAAADTNGDMVGLSFTLADCLPIGYTLRTSTKLVSELNDLGGTAQTGDAFARLGAPAGASVSADIADLPTVAEFNARTLAAADYTVVSDLPVAPDNASITAILEDTGTTLDALIKDVPTNAELATALGTTDDATLAAIAALNNLSSAQAQSAAAAALTAYDPPTNAELTARTLPTADYATATALIAIDAVTDKIDTALVLDGAVYQFTANALELAPAGGAGSSDLDEILSEHDTEDTLGNVLNDLVEEAAGLYRLTTAALAMAPGGGGTLYSYSDTVDDGSGNLLDGVYVQLSSTSNFADIIATTYTNAIGAFTVRSDTAGTHYLRLQLAGYNFSDQTVILA